MGERWPPVYDADSLASAIRELASRNRQEGFYSSVLPNTPCQGDIFKLISPQPIIAKDGEAAVIGDFEYWLITGNTCDLNRSDQEVPFSQIIPITTVSSDSFNRDQKSKLLQYQYSRRFYLPNWQSITDDNYRFADFTRATTIDKNYLSGVTIEASLEKHTWYLLHSCLVRYLARDDGRFD